MAFLSRIYLNPLRRSAQRLIASPQAMHAAVLGGLARQPVTERVLWRLETADPHRAVLYVVTASRPNWNHLVESAGWPDADGGAAAVKAYDPFLASLAKGQRFAFRVKANPTTATKRPVRPTVSQQEALKKTTARGVVVGERTARAQLDWFLRRTERWGFDVEPDAEGLPQLRIIERGRLSFVRSPQGSARCRVVMDTATFEGILVVVDPEVLRRVLTHGVGRGKAYGCGLVTLARPTGLA